MSHLKEPKGVDFLIQSPPLTEAEKNELSAFIQKRKMILKIRQPKMNTGNVVPNKIV